MDLASSVAGLLGLAGLAVNSASTLYTFCRKIPRVAGEVEAVVDEIRRLKETLESIQQVVADRGMLKLSSRTSRVIVKLRDEIKGCKVDLEAWNTSMSALKMEDGQWAKNALKKLKLAADGGRFSEMRMKVSAHRDQLSLLVELFTVDLEMLTSANIQTIESKVDKLAMDEASSQQITVSHLGQIQEGIQTSATLQSATQEMTLDISRSTDEIQHTLHEMRLDQTSSQHTTRLQVERLDATLVAIQRSLLGVSKKGTPRPRMRRTTRKMCSENRLTLSTRKRKEGSMTEIFSGFVQQTIDLSEKNLSARVESVNNLVDLAVTVRYRRGKAQYETLAIPDPEFEAADLETKLKMVKYLQDLRLLLWLLLRKQSTLNWNENSKLTCLFRSDFTPEAQLVSSWTHSTLRTILQRPPKGFRLEMASLGMFYFTKTTPRLTEMNQVRWIMLLDAWLHCFGMVGTRHGDDMAIFFKFICLVFFREWAQVDEAQCRKSPVLKIRTKGFVGCSCFTSGHVSMLNHLKFRD